MQITVGNETYASKDAVKKRCQELLKKGVVGEIDEVFLRNLLIRHRKAAIKIGRGVRRIYVDHDGRNYRCFWIERVDGTKTDFSYLACITTPTKKSEVMGALREAIRSQIEVFRDAAFAGRLSVPSAISGSPVLKGDHHVDHVPPRTFDVIAAEFLAAERISVDDVKIIDETDGGTTIMLADIALCLRWQDFHKTQAVLRIVSAQENLSQRKGLR